MEWVTAVLQKFQWPLTVMVIAVLIIIVFQRQIGELIANISSIQMDPEKRGLVISFGQRVRREQKRATVIPAQIDASRAVPLPPPMVDGAKQTGRDMTLEAFGAVQQVIYDACLANDISVSEASDIREALRRLGVARGLPRDLIGLVEELHDLGRGIARNAGLRPRDEDAQAYWRLAQSARQWLAASTLVSAKPSAPPRAAAPQRRPTVVVGADAVQPGSVAAAAALLGVAGPVQGQRFSIDKPNCRIGRNASNDVCIPTDANVSGDHAGLRYEKGGLFLADQNSRNGTFLNEQRITGTPVMVRPGDRIRLGQSVFEVVGASGNSRSTSDKGQGESDSSDRPVG